MGSQAPLHKLLVAVLLSGLLKSSMSADFSYNPGPNDPSHWGGKCQIGHYQSPIDFGESGIEERVFEDLALINYFVSINMTIINNGHTVQMTFLHPNRGTVAAGGLQGVYLLEQAHFHWPSEHTVAGKQYPLELHFVHYKQTYFSLEKALTDPEGIAVMAVLFHESPTRNNQLDPLLEGVQLVYMQSNPPKTLRRLQNLRALIPYDTNKFYRYRGSLTTPGCDESVIWTVFTESIPISSEQLQIFRQLKTKSSKPMEHNNRPLQPLNDRIVYFQPQSAPRIAWTSASPRVTTSTAAIVIFAVIMGVL